MKETNKSLVQYVVQLIQNKVAQEEIKSRLLAIGWSKNEIKEAYTEALINQGVPTPNGTVDNTDASNEMTQAITNKKISTLETVLNLFSFVLLGIIAGALGALFYQIINHYFPDALMSKTLYGYRESFSFAAIHYAMSALIIGFPIYCLSMYLWLKGFKKDKEKNESKLTKWLTYLILFVVSITIIGDLIALVYTFLQGELSMRFFLKTLTIFFITGIIFSFYFLERRKVQYHKVVPQNIFKIFGWAVTGIVLVAIIVGFVIVGAPSKERKRGFDRQRIRDLNELTTCINGYAQKYRRLPSSLNELKDTATYSYCAKEKDPETQKPYTYRVITHPKTNGIVYDGEFELCANFALESKEETNEEGKFSYFMNNRSNRWENHSAGRNCNKITARLRFPILSAPIKVSK